MFQFFPHDTGSPNGATWAALLREELTAANVAVYSEWCEEHGWCEWAEWLRLHRELESLTYKDQVCSVCKVRCEDNKFKYCPKGKSSDYKDNTHRWTEPRKDAIRSRLRELLVGPMVECRWCVNKTSAAKSLCHHCRGTGSFPPKVTNAETWFGVPGLKVIRAENDNRTMLACFQANQSQDSWNPSIFTATFRLGFPVVQINLADWWADGSEYRCHIHQVGSRDNGWICTQCDDILKPWHGYGPIIAKQWPVIAGVRTDRKAFEHSGLKPFAYAWSNEYDHNNYQTTLPMLIWEQLAGYQKQPKLSHNSWKWYPSREAADADLERVLLAIAYETEGVTV